jgi:hypothetical protein
VTLILGIDPGLSGALAMLDADGAVELLADLPIIRDRSLAWVDGGELQSLLLAAIRGRPVRATVERVAGRPGQGVSSAFTFGLGLGSVLGVLQAMHVGIEFVTPGQWKGALGLSKDKRASLDRARLLWPAANLRLAKREGRAEALLIAHHAMTRRTA